jgi:hypothetical protein
MPGQARLDSPGTVHHVIIRGIEKRRITWTTVKTDMTLCFAWVRSTLKAQKGQ